MVAGATVEVRLRVLALDSQLEPAVFVRAGCDPGVVSRWLLFGDDVLE